MRICYGILSSSTNGEIVAQLVNSLGSNSPVFVHHDFSQQPDFSLNCGANVSVIKDYVRTEWGGWSQAAAIACLLEHALANSSFDYFQLLSETCLPIRPLGEFDDYLQECQPDACMGLVKLNGRSDDIGTLNYAWRYYVPHRLMKRVIARLTQSQLDKAGITDPRARDLYQGLSVIKPSSGNRNNVFSAKKIVLNIIFGMTGFLRPFNASFHCYVGSTWFCLSRKTAEYLVSEIRSKPDLVNYYKSTRSPDESIFHTIVGNSGFKKIAPINHFISWQERQTGPDDLTEKHSDAIVSSGKFFARKFKKLADDNLRRKITGLDAMTGEPPVGQPDLVESA